MFRLFFTCLAVLVAGIDSSFAVECYVDEYSNCKVYVAESRYGNKHRRLLELAGLVKQQQWADVRVPLPRGLASTDIERFLAMHPSYVLSSWNELADIYEKSNTDETTTFFLDRPEVQQRLESIQASIHTAFSKASDSAHYLSLLAIDDEFCDWLAGIAAEGHYLMVRSSGDEDSTQLANAGGNTSVSYVRPNKESVLQAVGKVVASYFSPRSLKNRLYAEMNPFTQPLSIAVTIQELIGEPIGGTHAPEEVPVSLVLFSNEPNYVDHQNGRVMRLSAAYGHGEGVVGNLGIATDTILLVPSRAESEKLELFYDTSVKSERLAPMYVNQTEVELRPVPNESTLIGRRALTQDQLYRLYEVGLATESLFEGQAADMEIVVQGNIIYLVQARPVNRPTAIPRYLDKHGLLEQTKDIKYSQGKTLVSGLSDILLLENAEDLLIIDTLENAEQAFRRDTHKAVVTLKDEPANSHPVVNFSGMGVPCLYMSDQEQLNKVVTGADYLVMDAQQGLLMNWEDSLPRLMEHVREGYVVHPAPMQLSLDLADSYRLLSLRKSMAASTDLSESFHEIAQEDRQHAWIQLNELKNREEIMRVVAPDVMWMGQLSQSKSPIAHYYQNVISSYSKQLQSAFDSLEAALLDPTSGRLDCLLHVKAVQALLEQEAQPSATVYAFNLEQIIDLHNRAQQLLEQEAALGHSTYFTTLSLEDYAPTKEIANAWVDFFLRLDKEYDVSISLEHTQIFTDMIQTLHQFDVLSSWLCLHYSTIRENDSLLAFHLLVRDWDRGAQHQVSLLKEVRNRVERLQRQSALFSDLETLSAARQSLQDVLLLFVDKESSESVLALRQANAPLVQAIALSTFEHFVAVFDGCIKTVKASTNIDEQQRAVLFKEILKNYFVLLSNWHNEGHTQYLSIQQSLEKMTPCSEQLRPSPDFAVAAALSTNGAAYYRHAPQSLEDVFTLIHQELLALVNGYSMEIAQTFSVPYPALYQELKEKLLDFSFDEGRFIVRGKELGQHFSPEGLSEVISFILGSHSATAHLYADKETGDVYLTLGFYGFAGEDRWNDILLLGTFAGLAERVSLHHSHQKNGVTQFTWKIETDEQIPWVINAYQIMLEYSILEDFDKVDNAEFVRGLFEEVVNRKNSSPVALMQLLINHNQTGPDLALAVADQLHSFIDEISSAHFQPQLDAMLREGNYSDWMQGLVVLYSAGVVDRDTVSAAINYFMSDVVTSMDKETVEREADDVFLLLGLHALNCDQNALSELYARRAFFLAEQVPHSYRAYEMVLKIVEQGFNKGLLSLEEVHAVFDSIALKDDGMMSWTISQVLSRIE